MNTKKIVITKNDIDMLDHELEETEALGLNPLLVILENHPEMIALQRKDAKNLQQLYILNNSEHVKMDTYLEVNVDDE